MVSVCSTVTVFAWRRPDSHYTEIVTGSQDKCIRFWSLENRFEKPVATLPGTQTRLGLFGYTTAALLRNSCLDAHEDIIRGFTLLSETNVATCSNDGYANVWDFEKRKKVATNRIHDTFTFGTSMNVYVSTGSKLLRNESFCLNLRVLFSDYFVIFSFCVLSKYDLFFHRYCDVAVMAKREV